MISRHQDLEYPVGRRELIGLRNAISVNLGSEIPEGLCISFPVTIIRIISRYYHNMQDIVPPRELEERMERFYNVMDRENPSWETAVIFGKLNQYLFQRDHAGRDAVYSQK